MIDLDDTGLTFRADGKGGATFSMRVTGSKEPVTVEGAFVRRDDGSLVLASLSFASPEQGVGSMDLRRLPLDQLTARAHAAVAPPMTSAAAGVGLDPFTGTGSFLQAARDMAVDERSRIIALNYLRVQQEHGSGGVLQHLAALSGESPAKMRDWVRQARRSGYLTPGVKGKTGASAGPKLLEWMKRNAPDK